MHAISKITADGNTTIPLRVRKALKVNSGDSLWWELNSLEEAVVRRAQPLDVDYLCVLNGTLSEWNTAFDDEAYRLH